MYYFIFICFVSIHVGKGMSLISFPPCETSDGNSTVHMQSYKSLKYNLTKTCVPVTVLYSMPEENYIDYEVYVEPKYLTIQRCPKQDFQGQECVSKERKKTKFAVYYIIYYAINMTEFYYPVWIELWEDITCIKRKTKSKNVPCNAEVITKKCQIN